MRLEAIAIRLEATAIRLEAIAIRVEAIALLLLGWRSLLLGWRTFLSLLRLRAGASRFCQLTTPDRHMRAFSNNAGEESKEESRLFNRSLFWALGFNGFNARKAVERKHIREHRPCFQGKLETGDEASNVFWGYSI